MRPCEVMEKPFDVRIATSHEIFMRQMAYHWQKEGQKEKDCFLLFMGTLIADYQQQGKYELVDLFKRVRNIGSAYEPNIPEQ